ncbi:MAG: SO_0444 family Cu/Zn efflux transporter [Candidatus Omnitrophica bacterium]|nr:SO_0444 family Cu/Zn efflux transporter [Candidatus Omnitrophota bacterium]
MQIILGVIKEIYFLMNKMSVYLLFGFIFAGILHIFLKEGLISKHIGGNNLSSVVKASLFGIPLPLCSCGVLPAALALRKDGASKGAVLSFLISTPTTGVDSVLATYALLGGAFALYRVFASFVAGVFAGAFANIIFKNEKPSVTPKENRKCAMCDSASHSEVKHSILDKVKGVFSYAFGELLNSVGKWVILGIIIGGIISYFIPEEFVSRYLGSGILSMLIMLVIGIPMYVCSSGSIPIAAALMLKGMNPGAAFVFLLAGPATNSVALTVIAKEFGKKTVFIFLSAIIACSLLLGVLLNHLWKFFNINTIAYIAHKGMIPEWIQLSASIILLFFIILNAIKPKRR